MNSTLHIVIVTHNSEKVLEKCLACIDHQAISPEKIIIVDSGSKSTAYLKPVEGREEIEVFYCDNIGFAAANNLGISKISGSPEYVLLMNPDVFMEQNCLESAQRLLSTKPEAAMLTAKLKGFNLSLNSPTGLLDSTGVYRKWYGRWFDRGQGQSDSHSYDSEEFVPAVCGAFMFCRAEVIIEELPELFDESFYMYKEDIDLSLRLRSKGWKLLYAPEAEAYHCRGWSKDRKTIDKNLRLLASESEIKLNVKHHSPYIVWAVCKYLLVRVCNI